MKLSMEKREELLNRLRDPKFYLENFSKIKGKTPGLVTFKLKEVQKHLFNALNTYNRIISNKARQLGLSTAVAGYFYHNTIMNPGTNTALIGYNSDLTAELLEKVKLFYKTTPAEIRPSIHYNSKYEISFPKIDSKILVLPSTENVGRGYTLHNVLATELSAWEKAEEKMATLEASVPVTGKLVVESTPRGTGNLYHRMWVTPNNGYHKLEYGWWWEYTQEEIALIELRMNDESKFAQEYGLEFLTTGRPVFDQRVVRQMRKHILKVGDEYPVGSGYKVYEEDGWTFYKKPEEGKQYVVGADVAEGVTGGDYSTASVFDRGNGEEVAFYRGHIAPDMFGKSLSKIGFLYNKALLVVEVNNNGLVTLTELRNSMYPSLYYRPAKFDAIATGYTDKLGWRTTRVTRSLLIQDLNAAMRDGEILIHSKDILDEMIVFVYDSNNDMVPQPGFHDDTIFSTGIANQGFKVVFDTSKLGQIENKHLPHYWVSPS